MYNHPNSARSEIFTELNEKFKFHRTHVSFSKKQNEKYGEYLYLNPFNTKFSDRTLYVLEKIMDRGKAQYRIKVAEFSVDLRVSWWNEFKLNWIHGNHWINKESDWFKKTIITAIISTMVGALAYNVGYQNGVKAGKAGIPKVPLQAVSPPKR